MTAFNEKRIRSNRRIQYAGHLRRPGLYRSETEPPNHPKENMLRMLRGEMPLWVPNQTYDNNAVQPMVQPDAYASFWRN